MPRYMAAAGVNDLERTLEQADELIARPDRWGGVALLQCGRESETASLLAGMLRRSGRHAVNLVVRHRLQAQSDTTLSNLEGVSAVWVFAEDLFETFMAVFATPLAFALRARANEGMPVIGVGGGALALGGLLLANRVCAHTQFDLVGGLGWAPRVLVDGGADRKLDDGAIARSTVRSLPGLLGVDLGERGAMRVEGGRVDSIGDERIVLFGSDETGSVQLMQLEPGAVATIAPPPFAPFDRGLLPAATKSALSPEWRPLRPEVRKAPAPPPEPPQLVQSSTHEKPGSGRVCPMCKKVHAAEPRLSLAA